MSLLKTSFKPEFLNRIDDTILFAPLSIQVVKKIVLKLVHNLSKRLAEQDIELTISNEAQIWIAEKAYDPMYGARPLKRFITKEVETPLAKGIISGEIPPKSKVTITLKEDQLSYETVMLND